MMPTPLLQMGYEENGIPVSAMCGERMPQSQPRLNPVEMLLGSLLSLGFK